MFLVCSLYKELTTNVGKIPVSTFGDGAIGMMPVFQTYEQARAWVKNDDGYQIIELGWGKP